MDGLKSTFSTDIEEYEWKNNILPLMELLVSYQESEYQYRNFQMDSQLALVERSREWPKEKYDYRAFVAKILKEHGHLPDNSDSDAGAEIVNIYLKAIDLCRVLICQS